VARILPAYPLDESELAALERAGRRLAAIKAHRPAAWDATHALVATLHETGTIPRRLIELLRLRIAGHIECRYCMNSRHAPDVVGEALVCSLEAPEDSADLTPAEKAALRLADLMATNHLAVDDEVLDGLRAWFSEGEVVELTMHCALGIGLALMPSVWGVGEELSEPFAGGPDARARTLAH
jgi:alkylhydroperoxidase family enzyme